jgi:hypothetical protein
VLARDDIGHTILDSPIKGWAWLQMLRCCPTTRTKWGKFDPPSGLTGQGWSSVPGPRFPTRPQVARSNTVMHQLLRGLAGPTQQPEKHIKSVNLTRQPYPIHSTPHPTASHSTSIARTHLHRLPQPRPHHFL